MSARYRFPLLKAPDPELLRTVHVACRREPTGVAYAPIARRRRTPIPGRPRPTSAAVPGSRVAVR